MPRRSAATPSTMAPSRTAWRTPGWRNCGTRYPETCVLMSRIGGSSALRGGLSVRPLCCLSGGVSWASVSLGRPSCRGSCYWYRGKSQTQRTRSAACRAQAGGGTGRLPLHAASVWRGWILWAASDSERCPHLGVQTQEVAGPGGSWVLASLPVVTGSCPGRSVWTTLSGVRV